jgi:hypothetical protein
LPGFNPPKNGKQEKKEEIASSDFLHPLPCRMEDSGGYFGSAVLAPLSDDAIHLGKIINT